MFKRISGKKANQELAKKTEQVTDKDLQKVLAKEDKITQKVKGAGSLEEHLETVKLMFALIKAYWSGEYRQIPWFTIAAIVAALLYVLSPLDLIPDFIPVIGLMDDAMVLAACLKLVKKDLAQFEAWRLANPSKK